MYHAWVASDISNHFENKYLSILFRVNMLKRKNKYIYVYANVKEMYINDVEHFNNRTKTFRTMLLFKKLFLKAILSLFTSGNKLTLRMNSPMKACRNNPIVLFSTFPRAI